MPAAGFLLGNNRWSTAAAAVTEGAAWPEVTIHLSFHNRQIATPTMPTRASRVR